MGAPRRRCLQLCRTLLRHTRLFVYDPVRACFINLRVCMRAYVCACVCVRTYVHPCTFVRARACVYVSACVSARTRVRVRACLSANRCQPVPHNPMRDAEPARTCHAFARRSLGMILVGDLHCEAVAVEVNLDLLLCPVVLVAVSRAECTPAPRKRTGSPIRLVWGGLYTCNQRRENQRR